MEIHDHVTDAVYWPRCSRVELRGENLVYTVDWKRKYDLADKPSQLHVQFLKLNTDEELMEFMRNWGPLWQTTPAKITVRSSGYWAFQGRLKAGLELAQNAHKNDVGGLRGAILSYLEADKECFKESQGRSDELTFTESHLSLVATGNEQQPKEWVPKAQLSVLQRAATDCLIGTLKFKLHSEWEGRRLRFSWKSYPLALAEAIETELWNSLTGNKPVTLCNECQVAFLPESAHPQKYCSYDCAHRKAVRSWRRKQHSASGKPKRGKHAKAKKV